ncbi:hypothetical protein BJ138DRAFT_1137484 [Hygrophoropsis aurantiaca]|uniref:Uncharacterized protein n=1 Tax=Hygrophoropsis aurantiaca TaxID=72124 RepID=A0ACB8A331_9AGAM|nr:hypothetical protein BJ138DRAFT_1137484 [Hygrophoropsis aurantiaca]
MTDYLRRLVSGNKARFKDEKLNLELDLVYVTDQIIVMGYPATGMEGFYRNRREDAKKFLDYRHGKNFWVFNFCPEKENSYPASVFDGRVSRYPFPDHHVPALSILPLAAREMHAWLSGSRDRVVVLHCKAGKGRSGTLACTYLLSLDVPPTPPSLEQNYSSRDWAQDRADEWMAVMPTDDTDPSDTDVNNSMKIMPLRIHIDTSRLDGITDTDFDEAPTPNSTPTITHGTSTPSENSPTKPLPALQDVLDLHTSRRMKTHISPSKKPKAGVSIPSQRRWLFYWSLLLAKQGPSDFWQGSEPPRTKPKVRLTQVKLRMKELSGVKVNLVKAANMVIGRTSFGRQEGGSGHIWVSLARYDDDMVDSLERWERHTRDDGGHMGKRALGSEHLEGEELSQFFSRGHWDAQKMVRSFARLGVSDDYSVQKDDSDTKPKVTTYALRPLSQDKWVKIRDTLPTITPDDVEENPVPSEVNSMYDMTTVDHDNGIILDAHREVRIKLYMGQVFMGWLWIIPAFHMSTASEPTKLIFQRKDIDFALGVGSALVDVEVSMEWCPDPETVHPPQRAIIPDDDEAVGVTVTMQAVATGNLGEAVEAKQAVED